MIPRLVPEISSLDAFCDTAAAVVVGIGDSRSWMLSKFKRGKQFRIIQNFEEEIGSKL